MRAAWKSIECIIALMQEVERWQRTRACPSSPAFHMHALVAVGESHPRVSPSVARMTGPGNRPVEVQARNFTCRRSSPWLAMSGERRPRRGWWRYETGRAKATQDRKGDQLLKRRRKLAERPYTGHLILDNRELRENGLRETGTPPVRRGAPSATDSVEAICPCGITPRSLRGVTGVTPGRFNHGSAWPLRYSGG